MSYTPPSPEDVTDVLEYEKCKNAYEQGYNDAEAKKKFTYPKGGDEAKFWYYCGFDDFKPFELIDQPGN